MFVAQKKPNGWTLFFAFGEIACGLWAFVAGLLASETWQILFGLAMVSVAQQTAASYTKAAGIGRLLLRVRSFLLPRRRRQ